MATTTVNQTYANSAFTGDIIRMPRAPVRLMMHQPSHAWRAGVTRRLEDLIRLPYGWDGYSGLPVSYMNANFALQMLDTVCGPTAREPQVIPGTSGDLQIEWHLLKGDIELHVQAPFIVHAWRHLVEPNSQEQALELTNEFSTVATWVRELTEPDLAPAIAAA